MFLIYEICVRLFRLASWGAATALPAFMSMLVVIPAVNCLDFAVYQV